MRATLDAVCAIDARLEKVHTPEGWDSYRASELDVCVEIMCMTFDCELGSMGRRTLKMGRWILVPQHWMLVPADDEIPEHEEWVPDQWCLSISLEAR